MKLRSSIMVLFPLLLSHSPTFRLTFVESDGTFLCTSMVDNANLNISQSSRQALLHIVNDPACLLLLNDKSNLPLILMRLIKLLQTSTASFDSFVFEVFEILFGGKNLWYFLPSCLSFAHIGFQQVNYNEICLDSFMSFHTHIRLLLCWVP